MRRRRRNPDDAIPPKYVQKGEKLISLLREGVVENPPPPLTEARAAALFDMLAPLYVEKLARALFMIDVKLDAAQPSARDRLLVQYAFALIKASHPLAYVYAKGEKGPSEGTVLTDVAFTSAAISDADAEKIAKKVGGAKEYAAAQEALRNEGLIAFSSSKRKGGRVTKVSFNIQQTPADDIATAVMDAVVRVWGARDSLWSDEARKILGERPLPSPLKVEHSDGRKLTIPKSDKIFIRSMDHAFDAEADCATYWNDQIKSVGNAQKLKTYVKNVEGSIAKLLSDKAFLSEAAKYGESAPPRKADPFLVSIGAKAPTSGVPFRLIKGLSESMDMDARKAFISPYLLKRGFYYKLDDHSSRRPYCVANASPLVDVFKRAMAHYVETGEPLEADEVIQLLKGSAPVTAPAAPLSDAASVPVPRRPVPPIQSLPAEPEIPTVEVVDDAMLDEVEQGELFDTFLPTI